MNQRWLLVSLLAVVMSIAGCGKRDPHLRPDFVDTSNPAEAAKILKGAPQTKAAPPKTGGPRAGPRPTGS